MRYCFIFNTLKVFAFNNLHDILYDDNIFYCDYRSIVARFTLTSASHIIRERLYWSLKDLNIRSIWLFWNFCVSFDLKKARKCYQFWTLLSFFSMSFIVEFAIKSSTLCIVLFFSQVHVQSYYYCDSSLEICLQTARFQTVRLYDYQASTCSQSFLSFDWLIYFILLHIFSKVDWRLCLLWQWYFDWCFIFMFSFSIESQSHRNKLQLVFSTLSSCSIVTARKKKLIKHKSQSWEWFTLKHNIVFYYQSFELFVLHMFITIYFLFMFVFFDK